LAGDTHPLEGRIRSPPYTPLALGEKPWRDQADRARESLPLALFDVVNLEHFRLAPVDPEFG
jgi:hypothetical protein